MTNNYSTERIEQALRGVDVQLSTEDLSILVVGLIIQNKQLRKELDALTDEVYIISKQSEPLKFKGLIRECEDGTKFYDVECVD